MLCLCICVFFFFRNAVAGCRLSADLLHSARLRELRRVVSCRACVFACWARAMSPGCRRRDSQRSLRYDLACKTQKFMRIEALEETHIYFMNMLACVYAYYCVRRRLYLCILYVSFTHAHVLL